MSAATGNDSSTGRGRAILLIVVVAVLAVVAAVLTVVVSQKTYAPSVRTLSPKIQVAAGSEHVDTEAGVEIAVPEGWRVESGDLVFGSTVLIPEEPAGADGVSGAGESGDGESGAPAEAQGAGSLILVGALTPNLFASQEPDNQRAAASLVTGMGQFFLPVPGQAAEERIHPISSRAGDGWALSLRVLPAEPGGLIGPEGALVYSAVVGEGDQRYWLTYIGDPADGSMDSPGVEVADEIVERLTPTGGD